jgi:hypothetical protein
MSKANIDSSTITNTELEFDNTRAFGEGWGIFDCEGSANGPWQLQKIDEDFAFPSDTEAWQFVSKQVASGSLYHILAMRFLDVNNPTEFAAITTATNCVVSEHYEPDWSELVVLGTAASVAEALDKWYKHDRLNRPDGTRERIIADRATYIAAHGYDCLASFHDSVNGMNMYAKLEGGILTIYGDADRSATP